MGYGEFRGGGNFNRGGGNRGGSGGGRGGFGGGRGGGFSGAPREWHKAICSDCGQECEVPFVPNGTKPVYCKECFAKHRPPRDF